MQPEQQAILTRFRMVSQRDERVIAAFLGGSYATHTSDAYSDLDLYLITTDEAYTAFFAKREIFLSHVKDGVDESGEKIAPNSCCHRLDGLI